MGVVERSERFLSRSVPAAVKVDDRLHPGGVHLRQVMGHPLGRQDALPPPRWL